MALAHNIMVRNLNAIYLQAQGVSKPSDITDFIVFCQMVYETIHHHHHLEETIFFPMVANYTGVQGIMDGNLEQHHAFEDGLNKFKDYIYGTTFEQYDGKVLKEIIDTFGPALETHLADEIQTLLGLEKYGGERLLNVWHDFDKEILKQMGDKVYILSWASEFTDMSSIAFCPRLWAQTMLLTKEELIAIGLPYHGSFHIFPSTTSCASTREAGGSARVLRLGSRSSFALFRLRNRCAFHYKECINKSMGTVDFLHRHFRLIGG